MSRQNRRIGIGAGVLALAAMAVAGCSSNGTGSHGGSLPGAVTGTGSGGVAGQGSAIALVADAMTEADKAETVKMTGTMSVTGANAMSANLTAQEQYSPTLEMSMSIGAGGQDISEVLVGSTIYLQYPGLSSMTQGRPWAKIDLAEVGGALGSMSSILNEAKNYNPTTQLSALLASGDVTEVGKETVDGQPATHYHGKLTAAQVLALGASQGQLTQAQIDQLRSAFKSADIKTETIDLWVGSNDLPVEIKIAEQLASSTMSMDMHLSDWGAKVSIGAPPASQVYDLTAKLGSLGSS